MSLDTKRTPYYEKIKILDKYVYPVLLNLITSLRYTPMTNKELKVAVDLWCSDMNSAIQKHGLIKYWNTENTTDMSRLFRGYTKFNDDISLWDVSSVTDTSNMFIGCCDFNKDFIPSK